MVASTARGWFCCDMIGRIARVFTSSPTQARIQCELENATAVPRPIEDVIKARMQVSIIS